MLYYTVSLLLMKVVKELKYICSSADRRKIMQACHSDPTSGHMGVKRTIFRITERFFWKGVTHDVEKFVNASLIIIITI